MLLEGEGWSVEDPSKLSIEEARLETRHLLKCHHVATGLQIGKKAAAVILMTFFFAAAV